MTTEVFTITSSELEPDSMRDHAIIPEYVDHEGEPTADELEIEEPSMAPLEADDLELGEDPVHLYLHQIGRVQLLKASDEKIIARRIEIGRRISEIERKLQKQDISIDASQIYLEIVRELGQSWEIIHKLQENLGLAENNKLRKTITDVRFRDAIDGVIDPLIVQAIENPPRFISGDTEKISHKYR